MTYQELTEALEKLTGSDRRLDARIALTTDAPETMKEWWRGYLSQPDSDYPFKDKIPAYTASIDAAMTLVPDHCEFEIGSTKLLNCYFAVLVDRNGEYKSIRRPSPAIALCIACLRARAALKDA